MGFSGFARWGAEGQRTGADCDDSEQSILVFDGKTRQVSHLTFLHRRDGKLSYFPLFKEPIRMTAWDCDYPGPPRFSDSVLLSDHRGMAGWLDLRKLCRA
jgi:hypothetical protein